MSLFQAGAELFAEWKPSSGMMEAMTLKWLVHGMVHYWAHQHLQTRQIHMEVSIDWGTPIMDGL